MVAALPTAALVVAGVVVAAASPSPLGHLDGLPSYHYGAPIQVECMNRSSETGEHIELANHELQWIPFPACEETGKPLEFAYEVEAEVNCTIAAVSDTLFYLLEFYIHSDAPLSCRLPARPVAAVEVVGEQPLAREYVPLVFAVAGTLQLSHIHVSTHLNVLLHSMPKHHELPRDSGVLDSAVAYSTSPLARADGRRARRLIVGGPLPLALSVRWFPTPALPRTGGRVEWQGLGCRLGARSLFYRIVSFSASLLVAATYILGVVMPRRLRARPLGGATPLGHGLDGVSDGWGYSKRRD